MEVNRRLFFLTAWLVSATTVLVAGCDNGKDTQNTPSSTSTPGYSADSSTSETSIGATVDDSMITTKVKSALLADSLTEGFDAKVETKQGNVQISGTVDNQMQMDRIMEVARSVEGVKNVENRMTIKK